MFVMRIIICGDREWKNSTPMLKLFKAFPSDTIIVEGECRGADVMAAELAPLFGFGVKPYPALWHKYGKSAGPIRNTQMLVEGNPDAVYGFHNDIENSKGTRNMLNQALSRGVPAYLYNPITKGFDTWTG